MDRRRHEPVRMARESGLGRAVWAFPVRSCPADGAPGKQNSCDITGMGSKHFARRWGVGGQVASGTRHFVQERVRPPCRTRHDIDFFLISFAYSFRRELLPNIPLRAPH